MSPRAYVITRDDEPEPVYFIRLGLGIFWECSHRLADAKRFPTRAGASKTLHANGKHRQGWRVLTVNTADFQ